VGIGVSRDVVRPNGGIRMRYRLFITDVKGTFFGMSESGEASKGR